MADVAPSHSKHVRGLRQRVGLLYAVLITANVAAWLWAYSLFAGQPALLSTALLAYVFGLRHAVDPDHIAAIDNVTRKLMQDGQRPVTVGFWFALGHSTIIVIAAAAVAFAAQSLLTASEGYRELGSLISTSVSAAFLILIGVMLVAEAFGQHIDKGYIYFAMAFSLLVELLNMRLRRKAAPVELRHSHIPQQES